MSARKNTQLSYPDSYDVNNITFEEPIADTTQTPTGPVSYYRINIGTKNEDGTEGELVLALDKLPSKGIKELKGDDGNVNGYSISLYLKDKDGDHSKQQQTIDIINAITKRCAEHLMSIKAKVKKPKLTEGEAEGMDPIWQKYDDETGEVDSSVSPMIFPKLIYAKPKMVKDKFRDGKILTDLYLEDEYEVDKNGEVILQDGSPINLKADPKNFIDKPCYVTAALKIESIFVGQKIKLQTKIFEADMKLKEESNRNRRLLRKHVSQVQPRVQESVKEEVNVADDFDDEHDNKPVESVVQQELVNSDDEEEKKPKKGKGKGKK